MIKLREVTLQVLKKIYPRVYHQTAPKDAPFPYVVYEFPTSFINEDQEVFNLDVDVWDNADDTTEIETIASNIWKSLNRYKHIDKDMQLSIYRDSRLPPLDEKALNIKRRKLIFQLKYYDREVL